MLDRHRRLATAGALALTALLMPLCSRAIAQSRNVPTTIPAGPGAFTEKDVDKIRQHRLQRTVVEAYRKVHGVDENDPAVIFLRHCTDFSWQSPWSPAVAEAAKQGKALIDAFNNDPVVAMYYANMLRLSGQDESAIAVYRRALEGLSGGLYKDHNLLVTCAWQVRNLYRTQGNWDSLRKMSAKIDEGILASIVNGDFEPEEMAILYRRIDMEVSWCDDYAQKAALCQKLYDAFKKSPHPDPWMDHMLQGELHIQLAWEARGSDWASNVTDEGWRGFKKHLTIAREHLEKAYHLNPKTPEAAAAMITVAGAGLTPDDQGISYWFQKAVNAQFDYEDAYDNIEWFLRPRWSGSHREMLQFAMVCVKTNRYDTIVPYRLFHVVMKIANDLDSRSDIVLSDPKIYSELRKMLAGYANPPDGEMRVKALSAQAAIAWRTGKWDQARAALTSLGSNVDEEPFKTVGATDPKLARADIMISSDKDLSPLMSRARSAYVAKDFSGAAAAIKEAIDKAPKDELVLAFLKDRYWRAERLAQFSSGQWVSVMPGEALSGWVVADGVWKVDPDGSLVSESRNAGARIVLHLPLGQRFEVKGRMEFGKHPFSRQAAGLYYGKYFQWWSSLLLFRPQNRALLGKDFPRYEKGAEPAPGGVDAPVNAENEFHIQFWDGRVTAYVNGVQIYTDAPIPGWEPSPNWELGLCGYYWYDGAVTRFRDLQVRLLKESPNPTSASSPSSESGGDL